MLPIAVQHHKVHFSLPRLFPSSLEKNLDSIILTSFTYLINPPIYN